MTDKNYLIIYICTHGMTDKNYLIYYIKLCLTICLCLSIEKCKEDKSL